tara:strand:- start:33728 stop:34288 length:561 start_codon:yes stop_codon:yes gene_type:complete
MAKKTRLTLREKDILDGVNLPTLPPNATRDPVKPSESEKEKNASINDLGSSVDLAALLNTIRDHIKTNATFDPLSNVKTKSTAPEANELAKDLTNDQVNTLIKHVRDRVESVKAKANKVMDAVVTRQEKDPTMVTFDAKKDKLLKKGMVKAFKSFSNEITFDQYCAALEARKILMNKFTKEKMGDV